MAVYAVYYKTIWFGPSQMYKLLSYESGPRLTRFSYMKIETKRFRYILCPKFENRVKQQSWFRTSEAFRSQPGMGVAAFVFSKNFLFWEKKNRYFYFEGTENIRTKCRCLVCIFISFFACIFCCQEGSKVKHTCINHQLSSN